MMLYSSIAIHILIYNKINYLNCNITYIFIILKINKILKFNIKLITLYAYYIMFHSTLYCNNYIIMFKIIFILIV